MSITALPTPPTRADPANFAARGDQFLAALPLWTTQANALAAAMNLNSTTDTSVTSTTIGLGARTFVVTAGKSFQPGMFLAIASTAAPSTNAVYGTITSYSGTTLVMNITGFIGGGTFAAWTISQSAPNGSAALVSCVPSGSNSSTTVQTAIDELALEKAATGANTDIISLGNNTSTPYTTAGTATAYTITPIPAITAYAAGQSFRVIFGLASGAAPTIQISSVALPPALVMQLANGTYAAAVGIPAGHSSEVRLLSAGLALVVTMPPSIPDASITAPKLSGAQTGAAPIYGCRAWVNFEGSTGTIRASGNVASVTRNSIGDYTINFATAMQDASYTAVLGAQGNTGASNQGYATLLHNTTGVPSQTASAVRVRGVDGANSVVDLTVISVAIFR